jgi:NAD dependent epimerase/dehydratase family enzyme
MADLVLNGSVVSSNKIQKAGFTFQFTKLDDALFDLLKN